MYDRKINGRELIFGVSGKLYQSNVLLYGLCQIQRTIPWRSTRMSVGIAMESKPWVVNAPAAYNLMRSRKALRTRRRTSSGISSSESSPVSLITSL